MEQYSEEQKKKILDEFTKQIGEPFTTGRIRKEGGVALYVKLVGRPIEPSSISNLLNKLKDPEAFKAKQEAYALNKGTRKPKSVDLGTGNPLYNLVENSPYVLVPSHGDIHLFESPEKVKEAIEEFKSKGNSPINFKLFKAVALKVQTVVDCQIG